MLDRSSSYGQTRGCVRKGAHEVVGDPGGALPSWDHAGLGGQNPTEVHMDALLSANSLRWYLPPYIALLRLGTSIPLEPTSFPGRNRPTSQPVEGKRKKPRGSSPVELDSNDDIVCPLGQSSMRVFIQLPMPYLTWKRQFQHCRVRPHHRPFYGAKGLCLPPASLPHFFLSRSGPFNGYVGRSSPQSY